MGQSSYSRVPPPSLAGLVVGHPCSGAVSVADVKLRLSHTMTNTDGGKKVTAAMASTSRVVAGGLGAAKGAFNNWFGGFKAGDRSSKETSPTTDLAVEVTKEEDVDNNIVEPNDNK